MRAFFLFLTLTTGFASAQVQKQEPKFADRLLRPDMSLANPAQGRKFTAVGGTPVDKKFVTKSFYSGDQRASRSFWGSKAFSSKDFATGKFYRAEAAANARTKAQLAYANARFPTRESALVRSSAAEGKVVRMRAYADCRPFLGEGTRQEILSREDKRLTIDEVRQLLNRNR